MMNKVLILVSILISNFAIAQNECNLDDSLYINSSAPGPDVNNNYLPGTTVEFCYEINYYKEVNINFLHGVIPTLGNGYDASTLTATVTPPPAADNEIGSQWNWLPAGTVAYNNFSGLGKYPDGTPMGEGWWFQSVNSPGYTPPIGSLDPDLSWGDGCSNLTLTTPSESTCLGAGGTWLGGSTNNCVLTNCLGGLPAGSLTWRFCFSVVTLAAYDCDVPLDFNISVETFADGETGVWTDLGCVNDTSTTLSVSSPSPAPIFISLDSVIDPTCNGDNDGYIDASATGGYGTLLFNINGGAYSTTNIWSSLSAGTYTIGIIDDIGCTDTLDVTLVDPIIPASPIMGYNNPICTGTSLMLSASTLTGTTVTNYSWTGPSTFSSSLQAPTIVGATVANTGIYNLTADVDGCPSATGILNVNILPIATKTVAVNVCSGNNHTYADGTISTNITSDESHVSNLVGQAANMCDSVVTENITVLPIAKKTVAINVCSGNNHTYADGTISTNITSDESHVSNLVGQAANMCDSVVTENITVLPIATKTVAVNVCSGNNHTYADGTISTNITSDESHVSNLVGQAANMCDSIVTENITVLPIATKTEAVNVCSGNNHTYADGTISTNITSDESHVSNLVGQAANMCDSIVTENITVLSVPISNQSISNCDSLAVNGVMYYSTQNVIDTLVGQAANSCDSIITTNLIITNSTYGTDVHVACDSYTWMDGQTYTSSNTLATHIISNVANCDSVITLDLTINNRVVYNQSLTNCDSLSVNGTIYYSSQMVYDTLIGQASNMCDSIVITDLTINNAVTTMETKVSCGPTMINGTLYSTDTVVVDFFPAGTTTNCDSTHITDLSINTFALTNLTFTDCDSAVVFGTTFMADTVLYDTLVNGSAQNCDSITIITVSVNYTPTTNQMLTKCDSMIVNGNMYYSTQMVYDTLSGSLCDSIVITDLTINSGATYTDSVTITTGDSLFVGGAFQTNPGTFYDTLMTSANCDSIVTTILDVLIGIEESIKTSIKVYPNPLQDVLFINADTRLNSIELIDTKGRLVRAIKLNDSKTSIDIKDLKAGMYFYKIITINNELLRGKLIKE